MSIFRFTGYFLAACFTADICRAEIQFDGTIGPNVVRDAARFGNDHFIDSSDGRIVGSNLFHSFSKFSIPAAESANFVVNFSPAIIDNVISRVTGGTPSNINGAFNSFIPGANFWFLNPAGVIFGEQASINVTGSFHVSTANYLKFADGSIFGADQASAPVLTTAAPEAFGFLGGKQPAPINFEGSGSGVTVPEGKTLSVIGGDITITGGKFLGTPVESRLQAPGGRINIASVASAGEVTIKPDGLDTASFDRLGKIEIQGVLDRKSAINTSGEAGGAVFIRAGELVMDNSYVAALTFGAGNGGGIDIKANSLKLSNGAQIDTSSYGSGQGGNLNIAATNISLIGGNDSASGFFSQVHGDGNAGFLKVTADFLDLKNGALINAETFRNSRGDGGAVFIRAGELVMDNSYTAASTFGAGSSGGIDIKATGLKLSNGAQIDTSTYSTGKGGTLTVISHGDINISGPMGEDQNQTGIFSVTNDTGPGGSVSVTADGALTMDGSARILTRTLGTADAGLLNVKAGNLTLSNGAQIFAGIGNTMKNNLIQGNRDGTGKGGDIFATVANTLSISGYDALIPNFRSGIFSAGQIGRGDAGNISVSAKTIELRNQGTISAFSGARSLGKAGNIIIREVDNLNLKSGSTIETEAIQADGGNIDVRARDLVFLIDSAITASVQSSTGKGGNITIDPIFVILDNSKIIANAFGGPGGNIRIVADQFIASPDSIVDASSQFGVDGQVVITSPDTNMIGKIATLTAKFLDPSTLFKAQCEARYNAGLSSLVVKVSNTAGAAPGEGYFIASYEPDSDSGKTSVNHTKNYTPCP
ncbi:filamentous hemagglutinin N-terminal domain-containing protein [Candidatus Methylobacter favarea]|uniref:two-partner secretion domain-containing protein n=1 Tax=Candidatus Methylobacter favarea TaxID=2707345 RepID=UPI00157D8BA4|nr:filamentous hemagglutinin N-terminal domain-containing protein [Candidatus Methylobacter favarea]